MSALRDLLVGTGELAGLLLTLLVAFLVGAFWQAARANRERRRAEQLRLERDALRRAHRGPGRFRSVAPDDVEREAAERRARIVVLVGEPADQAVHQ